MNLFSKGKDEYISHHRRSAQLHLIQNNGFFSHQTLGQFYVMSGFHCEYETNINLIDIKAARIQQLFDLQQQS